MSNEHPRPRLHWSGRVAGAVFGVALALAAAVFWVLHERGGVVPRVGSAADTSGAPLQLGRVEPGAIGRFEERVSAALPAGAAPARPLRRGIRIQLSDLSWTDRQGRPFLQITRAVGTLDAQAVKRGRYEIDDVVASNPRVLLVQPEATAEWNYVPVLGFDRPPSAPGPVRTPESGIYLRDVRLVDGRVELRRADGTYVADQLQATLPAVSMPSGARPATVQVARLASQFMPSPDQRLPLQATGAELTLPGGKVDLRVQRVQLGETIVADAQGTWSPDLPGYGFRATGRAERVHLADVRFISPKLPEAGSAQFSWRVEPRAGGTFVRLSDLEVRSGASDVRGGLAAVVGGTGAPTLESIDLSLNPVDVSLLNRFLSQPLPYTGTLSGRVHGTGGAVGFDVAANLAPAGERNQFTTTLTGELSLGPEGVRLRSLQAELSEAPLRSLRGFVPKLPLAGALSGKVALTGPPSGAPMRVNVRLDAAGGVVVLQGTMDISGPQPVYDLEGSLIDVRPAQLLEPKFPPVTLTARFTLRGRGTDPRTLDAALTLDGHFAGWYAGSGDRLTVRASARDGLLRVSETSGAMGPVALELHGEWALAPGRTASGLEYHLAVSSLAPLGPYLPTLGPGAQEEGGAALAAGGGPLPGTMPAGGSVDLRGTATGSLQRPTVEGELRLEDIRYGAWAVRTAEGSYRVALGDSLPTVHANVAARGIQTPNTGAFEAASLKGGLTPPGFAVELNATRVGGGALQLVADGSLASGGRRSATVRRFFADLGRQRWTLEGPAEIQWGGAPGVVVQGLVVSSADGRGRVSLDGTLLPLRLADLTFDISALPAGDVQQLAGIDPYFTGTVWARGTLLGGRAPRVEASFRVQDGESRGVRFSRIEGSLSYADLKAVARATAAFQPSGQVSLDATLPLRLDVTGKPKAEWVQDGQISGSLSTDALPLAILSPLAPQVRDLKGTAGAHVQISGTPASPHFEGSGSLVDGAVTIPVLDRQFTDIVGEFTLSNEVVQIQRLQARSDGTATAHGTITFQDLSHPVADLSVDLDRFRPVGVRNLQPAATWGTVTIKGTIPRIELGGRLRLDDGNVRVPEFGSDPFQEQVEQFLATGQQIAVAGLPAPPSAGVLANLGISGMTVEAGEGVWFVTQDARAQLGGELTVFKSGQDVKIFGALEGDHGTFTLQAGLLVRRFEVRQAQIRFLGSPTPNPALDITASRVVYPSGGQQVDVLVHVGGTLRTPTLSLSSQGTSIPESELLSFLLFGQPSFALGQSALASSGGTPLISGTILRGSVADWLSMQAEQLLVERAGLPVDYFQVRFAETTVGGNAFGGLRPTVIVGKELGNDVFLTVNAGVASLFGSSSAAPADALGVSLEWRMDPEWTLEGGWEPLIAERFSRLGLVIFSSLTNIRRQVTLDLRRRWTY